MIEYEAKLLDKEYLTTRIRDFKDIKNGLVLFAIKESNREDSLSVYIEFYVSGSKRAELRISDHYLKQAPQTQFIVYPCKILAKKRKELFVRTIENVINKAKIKEVNRKIKMLDKNN